MCDRRISGLYVNYIVVYFHLLRNINGFYIKGVLMSLPTNMAPGFPFPCVIVNMCFYSLFLK